MAAKTLTITANMAASPKALHAGENCIAWDYNSGASKLGTLSDVLLLGKIPSGALITTQNLRFGAAPQAGGGSHYALELLAVESAGTFSTWATLIASMTNTSTAASTFQSFIPKKVSLSDDRTVQYVVLALNCTTGSTETTSVSIQGFVKYFTDGSTV